MALVLRDFRFPALLVLRPVVGDAFELAEDLFSENFAALEFWDDFEDDILHFSVEPDAVKRIASVDDHIAFRARVALFGFESLDYAALAEGVETLSDSRGVYQVALADVTGDVRVQGLHSNAAVHGLRKNRCFLSRKVRQNTHNTRAGSHMLQSATIL